METIQIRESAENYLETILVLKERNGTVRSVDDTGTVFVRWDNGSGLGVVYGVDRIRKL